MRVPSTSVQNNFGKYLKFVQAGEEIIVTKKGKEVATISRYHEAGTDFIMESAEAYHTAHDRIKYEQFLELVDESEHRFELIDGVIYNLASPTFKHQKIVSQLNTIFNNYFSKKPCIPLTAPFDVTLRKTATNICVVQPDILILCDKDNIDEHGKYHGVPELVVEVLSPSTQNKDLLIKLDLYKQCGIHEYWIVDPDKTQIMVYFFEENEIKDYHVYTNRADDRIASTRFAGLQIMLSQIFT